MAGPGDVIVQPPTIRHQVLQTDDGLEVLELVSPAEHTTHADPELGLPTRLRRPDRWFGGQRFLFDSAQGADSTSAPTFVPYLDHSFGGARRIREPSQGPNSPERADSTSAPKFVRRATAVREATQGQASVTLWHTTHPTRVVRPPCFGVRTWFLAKGEGRVNHQEVPEGTLMRDEGAAVLCLASNTTVIELEVPDVPVPTERNVFVVGNSGAGKSTWARALARADGRVHVDLDAYAWAGTVGIRRNVSDAAEAIRHHLSGRPAVVEGCYADLVDALAEPQDALVWLDIPLENCVSHCESRPFEPHKWETAAAQDAFLPRLIEFVRAYDSRTDAMGRLAHTALFDRFSGPRARLQTPPTVGSE